MKEIVLKLRQMTLSSPPFDERATLLDTCGFLREERKRRNKMLLKQAMYRTEGRRHALDPGGFAIGKTTLF
jgi:hypothetical protein